MDAGAPPPLARRSGPRRGIIARHTRADSHPTEVAVTLPRHISIASLISLAAAAFPASAQKTEPGVYWEQTFEMKMQGMAMPPQTMRACMPKGDWTEPPKSGDESCKVSNLKRSGNKMSWHFECEGKEKMSGDGEFVRSGDTYAGTMTMNSSHGQMVTNIKGRKLGGDCDAAAQQREMEAQKKQVEQMQAQQKSAMSQACDGAVEKMSVRMLEMMRCNDRLKEICARLPTVEGYRTLTKNNTPQDQQAAAKACNKDLDAVRSQLCANEAKKVKAASATSQKGATAQKGIVAQKGAAGGGSSASDASMNFLTQSCPAESREIAQAECAGQSFCDMEPAQRDFCVKYAQDVLDESSKKKGKKEQPPTTSQPTAPPTGAPADQAKKAVKGLLPF
jgi:hypothetical protein